MKYINLYLLISLSIVLVSCGTRIVILPELDQCFKLLERPN